MVAVGVGVVAVVDAVAVVVVDDDVAAVEGPFQFEDAGGVEYPYPLFVVQL